MSATKQHTPPFHTDDLGWPSRAAYKVMDPSEVELTSDSVLKRTLDAVPDLSRLDLGPFTVYIEEVELMVRSHPLRPPHNDADTGALVGSIARFGRVILPIFFDQHGRLLDGAQRLLAAAKVQSEPELRCQLKPITTIFVMVDSKLAETELVHALNLARRGGTQAEYNGRRQDAVRVLLRANHPGTDRVVALLAGYDDPHSVKKIRLELESRGEIAKRMEFVDKRGYTRQRTANYDRIITTCDPPEFLSAIGGHLSGADRCQALRIDAVDDRTTSEPRKAEREPTTTLPAEPHSNRLSKKSVSLMIDETLVSVLNSPGVKDEVVKLVEDYLRQKQSGPVSACSR